MIEINSYNVNNIVARKVSSGDIVVPKSFAIVADKVQYTFTDWEKDGSQDGEYELVTSATYPVQTDNGVAVQAGIVLGKFEVGAKLNTIIYDIDWNNYFDFLDLENDVDTLAQEFAKYVKIADLPDVSSKADKSDLINLENRVNALDVTSDIKGVVNIASDRYLIHTDKQIYGIRRATRSDTTEVNTNLNKSAPVVNSSALDGRGAVTEFYTNTYQWLTYNFASDCFYWDVTIEYQNFTQSGGSGSRFKVNGVNHALSGWSGTYKLKVTAPTIGTRLNSLGYEEATGRTYLIDMYARISDSNPPTCFNDQGQPVILATGDTFRIVGQGLAVTCRYEGIDPISNAWKATPTYLLTNTDSQLILGSGNAIQNDPVAREFATLRGNVPSSLDSLEKLANKIQHSAPRPVISNNEPDDSDWIEWFHVVKDYDKWEIRVIHYVRLNNDAAYPLNNPVPQKMLDATHSDAVEVADNRYSVRLPRGASLTYDSPRNNNQNSDMIAFPANTFSHFQHYFIDATGSRIGAFGSNKSTIPTNFTGQSISYSMPLPADTTHIRVILTRSDDNSEIIFDIPAN